MARRALPLIATGIAILWLARSFHGSREPARPSAASPAPLLPPALTVDGMRGFRSHSSLRFLAPGSLPHQLEVVYAFPARAHWRLWPEEGGATRRRLVYRAGSSVYLVHPGSDLSVPLEGEELALALLRTELRMAAMLWPAGAGWQPGRDPDRVEVEGIGFLEARGSKGPGERPKEFESFLPDGRPAERFSEVRWSRQGGREWPSGWVLAIPSGPVWEEHIERVVTGGLYSDAYFLPPDRQPDLAELAAPRSGRVQQVELPPRALRRFPLPRDAGWVGALEEAASLLASWRGNVPEPPGLDPRVEVELSLHGEPLGLALRLAQAPPELPAGWERVPGSSAASLFVRDPRLLGRRDLETLRGASGEGGSAPYCLLDPAEVGRAWVQVVQPLRSAR